MSKVVPITKKKSSKEYAQYKRATLIEHYRMIQRKESKLSTVKRGLIVAYVNALVKKGDISPHELE